MLDSPSFTGSNTDSELPWFHPTSIEVDLDLLLSIANHWKEKHVDEVLQPALQKRPAPINEFKKSVSQVKEIDLFYLHSHLI